MPSMKEHSTNGRSTGNGRALNVEAAVRERYSGAAQQAEAALCCPVEYDTRYLEIIPEEVLERDYGCGDPSRHVAPGEVVLDLGSGGGKICFIAAQIVGSAGRVIGIDCNDAMLDLARRHQPTVAQRLGFDNIEFRKGKIQDLQLNLQLLDEYLQLNPATDSSDWLRVTEQADHLRESHPLVADGSVDVVVSNCVLNLVREDDRRALFSELHRVLKRGGRAVISDIVADEDVPHELQRDPKLWSGCISGAFREDRLFEAFEEAGFYGIELLARQEEPWAVVEGIEFRSVTVRAYKGKDGPCLDRRQAVIYQGPWKAVIDDDGHKLVRGQRTAVCDKTYRIYGHEPYTGDITQVPPAKEVPLEDAPAFDCRHASIRSAQETKLGRSAMTILADSDCCGPADCC